MEDDGVRYCLEIQSQLSLKTIINFLIKYIQGEKNYNHEKISYKKP